MWLSCSTAALAAIPRRTTDTPIMRRLMRHKRARTHASALLASVGALLGLLAPGPATASGPDDLLWSSELDAGVEHTSNLNRSEQAPEAATFATVTGNYTLIEQTQSVYADLNTVDTWRDFPTGTPGGDFTPALNTFLLWTPVLDMFSWRLSDNLGEISPNSNGALAQPGRESVNVASTGPNLLVPLGGSNLFTASARYSRINFQTSTQDNGYREVAQAGIGHVLAYGGILSFNGSEARTVADVTGVPYDV